MLTKYYSDLTRQYYDSQRECLEAESKFKLRELAEKKAKQLKEEADRKAKLKAENELKAKEKESRKKAVFEARDRFRKADAEYTDLLTAYDEDYPEDDLVKQFLVEEVTNIVKSAFKNED